MIPDLDRDIGIGTYSTSFAGCGGRIRTGPDDFEVEEIISPAASSRIKEDDGYAVYILRKKGIDTNHALGGILRLKGLRLKALGLKDAHAETRQYVCAMNRSRSVAIFESDKFSLTRVGYTKRPLTKKDMVGNRFTIQVSGHDGRLGDFAEADRVLNFYGYQRFGSRRAVTHLVGKAIVQRDFAGAVEHILAFTSPYDSEENTAMRRDLLDSANYARVLQRMPARMDIERAVLAEMIRHGDPLASLRAVPVQIRRMYVQAYQSYLFNRTVSTAFDCGEDLFSAQPSDVCYDRGGSLGKFAPGLDQRLAVPMVGYSYYKKTRFDYYVSDILQQEEISHRDFFIKELQEVSGEGGFRDSVIRCEDFAVSGSAAAFTLGRGSFATVLLREVIKPGDPVLAGF